MAYENNSTQKQANMSKRNKTPARTAPTALIVSEPTALDRNPAAVYLAQLKPTGRRVQRQALDVMAGWLHAGDPEDPDNPPADAMTCNWPAVRYQHTNAIRTTLSERYAPATADRMLSALRGVLRECRKLGLMPADDYAAAVDFKSLGGQDENAPLPGRDLSQGEISALMTACMADPTAAGARDAAIIAVMVTTGLRRAEVVSIDLADYEPTTGCLTVHGKGKSKAGKLRTVYAVNGAGDALADWLAVRGNAPGALFVSIDKAGRLDIAPREMRVKGDRTIDRPAYARMANQAIYNMLEKRAIEAGISDAFSPHDLRRTALTDLLAAGADLGTVSKIAGHSDPRVTMRYDRRKEEAKRQAQTLLHVPYRRRRNLANLAPQDAQTSPSTGQAPNVEIRPQSARHTAR